MGRGDGLQQTHVSASGGGSSAGATARGRNKITPKTRLKVVHSDVAVTAEDDFILSDGKSLATGVDAEDANEFHLLAVLAASQQSSSTPATFCQTAGGPSTTSSSASNASRKPNSMLSTSHPPQPSAPHIPTPDATGKVANYATFYPDIAFEPSTLLSKASITLEDAQDEDVLSAGYAYTMDERDFEWLERSNKLAEGQGPSSSPSASTTLAPVTTPGRARSAKARGKEPEVVPAPLSISTAPTPMVISEDEFELVMGLFERVTEERLPCLHVTPTDVPPLSDYETFFSSPLPPHFFPSFSIPTSIPSPETLYKYARIIYPYWRDRKLERGCRRIIPQLNYDESNDSDPYVCFRRREHKPVRKTRRQDTTSLDRMLKLADEMDKLLSLTKTILERETVKADLVREGRSVIEKRVKLVEVKRKMVMNGMVAGGGVWDDEELFSDRSALTVAAANARRREKQLMLEGTQTGMIRLRRLKDSMDISPSQNGLIGFNPPPNAPFVHHTTAADMVLAKFNELTMRIEKDAARRREKYAGWEDAFSSDPISNNVNNANSARLFRNVEGSGGSGRMRVGRGGRVMFDRRFRPPPLSSTSTPTVVLSKKRTAEEDEEAERQMLYDDRWKYDSDLGVSVGGSGWFPSSNVDEDQESRLIIDDYEHKSFLVRRHLIFEEDFNNIYRSDDGPIRRAEMHHEMRKEADRKFSQEAISRAAIVRKEMAARNPPPTPPPPTPLTQIQPTPVPTPTPQPVSVSSGTAAYAQLKKAGVNQRVVSNGVATPVGIPVKQPHPLSNSSPPQPPPSQPPVMPSPQLQSQALVVPQVSVSAPQEQNGMVSHTVSPPKPVPTPVPQQMNANSNSPYVNGLGLGGAGVNVNTNGMLAYPAMTSSPSMHHVAMRANGLTQIQSVHQQQPMMLLPQSVLTTQQALGLKNVFSAIPQQQIPQQYNAMILGGSQNVQDVNLSMGNGNIPLKLPTQRAMQLAAAANGKDMSAMTFNGQVFGQTQPNTSPRQQQTSPVNGQRLAVMNRGSPLTGRASPGVMMSQQLLIQQHQMQQQMQQQLAAQGQLPNGASPSQHSSPLIGNLIQQQQQTVGGPVQGHMNGY